VIVDSKMPRKTCGALDYYDEDDYYSWSSDYDDENGDFDGEEQTNPNPNPNAFCLSDAFEAATSICNGQEKKTSSSSQKDEEREVAKVKKELSIHVPYVPIDDFREQKLLRFTGKTSSDLLSALDDTALILIAYFLPLSSISALSCVNRELDFALSADFLYCPNGNINNEGSSQLLLPCLKSVPRLLPMISDGSDRPKGVARKFALESGVFSKVEGRATFQLVDEMPYGEYGRFISPLIFLNSHVLAFVTDEGQIVTRNIFTKKSITLDAHDHEIRFCASFKVFKGENMCAVLSRTAEASTPMLSLVDLELPPSSTSIRMRRSEHKLRWKKDLSWLRLGDATLQFSVDGGRLLLLVGTLSGCWIMDATTGKEIWSRRGTANSSYILEKNILIISTGAKSITLYDINDDSDDYEQKGKGRKCCASFDVPSQSHTLQMTVLDGRLWVQSDSKAYFSEEMVSSLSISGDKKEEDRSKFHMKATKQKGNCPMAGSNGMVYFFRDGGISTFDPSDGISTFDPRYKVDVLQVYADNTKLIIVGQRTRMNTQVWIYPMHVTGSQIIKYPQLIEILVPFDRHCYASSTHMSFTVSPCGNYLAFSRWVRDEQLVRVINIQKLDPKMTSYNSSRIRVEQEKKELELQRNQQRQRNQQQLSQCQDVASKEQIELAAEEKRQKIIVRKEAKQKKNREKKTKDREDSKRKTYGRSFKEFR